jgi:UPF0271 protein
MKYLDINLDIGEGFNIEEEVMPLINSCNIACGGHAGNILEMTRLISLAKKHQVKIGAHPSYPDKENFGRVSMDISKKDLKESLEKQLIDFLELLDNPNELHHVKPHGAFYNDCAINIDFANIMIEIILEYCPKALLFTLPNSIMAKRAKSKGINVWREAFIDRGYNENGQLQNRGEKGAILTNSSAMFQQLKNFVINRKVKTINGKWISIEADTFCVHGDHPNAYKNLREVLQLYKQIDKK